jgi:hypothetical protein
LFSGVCSATYPSLEIEGPKLELTDEITSMKGARGFSQCKIPGYLIFQNQIPGGVIICLHGPGYSMINEMYHPSFSREG